MPHPCPRPAPLWHDTLPWLTTLPLCAAALGLQAQPLADPTRPPAALAAPTGPTATRAAGVAAAASAARAAAPVLHGVQLPLTADAAPERRTALVGDRVLRVGDRCAERTLVAIDAQGVTWRNAHGALERQLLLAASIVKQPPAAPAPVPAPATPPAAASVAAAAPAPAAARAASSPRRNAP